jgi:hypothetical protein
MKSSRYLIASCISIASLFAVGCGSETATVSGTVTSQGKPVKNGSVILYCADKQIVRGLIVDGKYTIPNVPCGSVIATVQAHAKMPAGLRLQQHLPTNTNRRFPPQAEAKDPPTIETGSPDASGRLCPGP